MPSQSLGLLGAFPLQALWTGDLTVRNCSWAFRQYLLHHLFQKPFKRKDSSWRNNPLSAHPDHRKWMLPRCSISADVKCREAQTPGQSELNFTVGLSLQQSAWMGQAGGGVSRHQEGDV